MTQESDPGVSPVSAALRGYCPRCGKGPLFNGVIALAPTCTHCGLKLSDYEQDDGPAFFSLTVVGFVVVGGAMALELLYQPPYWVHAALWLPLTLLLSLLCIRIAKAWLVGEQYRHDAGEGRLSD